MLIIGMATVYSVAYNAEHPNIYEYSEKYGKQLVWLGISLFLGLIVFLIDSDIYRKFSVPIYAFTLFLLVIVLFTPKINGASAWLGIGPFGVQPAEFAKIGTALLLARFVSTVNVKQQNIQTVLIANAIILMPMVLILLQPDAGTFVVFTSFLFVMYREGITYDPLILKLINRIPDGGMEDMEGEIQIPDRESSSSFSYLFFMKTENNVPYVPFFHTIIVSLKKQ